MSEAPQGRIELDADLGPALLIQEFVNYVRASEPGTLMYAAWERQDDPTRFTHLFIFADEDAQQIHSASAAVAQFEVAYRPHLVGGDVAFTDFDLVASNQ